MGGGDINFYAYPRNAPVSFEDPYGLSSTVGRGSCQPQCFAQLKYRPVDDWRGSGVHPIFENTSLALLWGLRLGIQSGSGQPRRTIWPKFHTPTS